MKKRLLLVIMVVMMLVSLTACTTDPISKAKESVVRVYTEAEYRDANGNSLIGAYLVEGNHVTDQIVGGIGSLGSAFAVGDNPKEVRYFVTNRHVVADEEIVYITAEDYEYLKEGGDVSPRRGYLVTTNVYIVYDHIQNRIPANVQYVSDEADMAILFIHTPTNVRKPATLRPFKEGELSDNPEVRALGFPAVADWVLNTAGDYVSTIDQITVTRGIVSKVINRAETNGGGEQIQTDADINGGNSGGPLVDTNGCVLGINTSGIDPTVAGGINFAVSVNEVVRMLDNQGIAYLEPGFMGSAQMIGIIILAVLIIAVVVVIVMTSLKQKKPATKRTITGVKGALAGKSFEVKPGTAFVLGSDVSCNIQFNGAQGVSRRHCSVKFDGKTVVVRDENSSYGTFIEGVKIEKGQTAVWHRGQKLSLGSENESVKLS